MTTTNLYSQLCSYENLKTAFKNARKGWVIRTNEPLLFRLLLPFALELLSRLLTSNAPLVIALSLSEHCTFIAVGAVFYDLPSLKSRSERACSPSLFSPLFSEMGMQGFPFSLVQEL